MQRVRRMQRDYVGNPIAPNPIPDDGENLLELMDEALEHAGTAQGLGLLPLITGCGFLINSRRTSIFVFPRNWQRLMRA